ncbi:MAG: ATP-binding protein [Conexivisphaerales archaeon]
MSIGVVDVGSKPYSFSFIAKRLVKVGEYVIVDTDEGRALALVEDSTVSSQVISNAMSYESAVEGSRAASENPRDKRRSASAKVLGLVEELKRGYAKIPSVPSIPGTEVYEADPSTLTSIFARDGWLKLGTLLRNSDVSVGVDPNKIASRHLAILAATGGGKSNLLALIAKRIAELNGSMLILDYHGEYSDLNLPGVVHIQAKVNPRLLDVEELAGMLDVRERAEKQRSVLHRAFTKEVKEAGDFWGELVRRLEEISSDEEEDAQDKRTAERLIEIIQRALRRKGNVLDPDIKDPLDQLQPNRINVLNMLELTEAQADTVISYYLDRILEDRKAARRISLEEKDAGQVKFSSPIIIAIEEAHTFLPAGDATNKTKSIAAKIAREGRKFGVALIVVSQRPSRLDQDILSQMGSLAVLRITQPKDQSYIMESTELLSEELGGFLPSLNVGEAILLGQWVVLPSMVRVEKVAEKLMGADINAVEEWAQAARLKKVAKESTADFIRME